MNSHVSNEAHLPSLQQCYDAGCSKCHHFPSFLWFTQPGFVVLQEVYTETVFVGNYGLAGFEIGVTTDELPGDGAGNVSTKQQYTIRSHLTTLEASSQVRLGLHARLEHLELCRLANRVDLCGYHGLVRPQVSCV